MTGCWPEDIAKPRHLVVEADGGSRGNPGPAGFGAVVRAADELLIERAEYIGTATNNVAEYRGLIAGLEAAAAINPAAQIIVRMDSKLVCEQMAGRWKIKHPDMRELALRARGVFTAEQVHYEWIPRAQNTAADALANEAMDGGAGTKIERYFGPLALEKASTHAQHVADKAQATDSGEGDRLLLVCSGGLASASLQAALTDSAGAVSVICAPDTAAKGTATTITALLQVPSAGRSLDPRLESATDVADVFDSLTRSVNTTVIVAGSPVIQALIAEALGLSPTQAQLLELGPGAVTTLRLKDSQVTAIETIGARS